MKQLLIYSQSSAWHEFPKSYKSFAYWREVNGFSQRSIKSERSASRSRHCRNSFHSLSSANVSAKATLLTDAIDLLNEGRVTDFIISNIHYPWLTEQSLWDLLTAKSAREHIKIWGTSIPSEICGRKSSGNLKNIMITMRDLMGYRWDLRWFRHPPKPTANSAVTHQTLMVTMKF